MKEQIIKQLRSKITEENEWARTGSWGEVMVCRNRTEAYEHAIEIVEKAFVSFVQVETKD